jgi:hypothetical protein
MSTPFISAASSNSSPREAENVCPLTSTLQSFGINRRSPRQIWSVGSPLAAEYRVLVSPFMADNMGHDPAELRNNFVRSVIID